MRLILLLFIVLPIKIIAQKDNNIIVKVCAEKNDSVFSILIDNGSINFDCESWIKPCDTIFTRVNYFNLMGLPGKYKHNVNVKAFFILSGYYYTLPVIIDDAYFEFSTTQELFIYILHKKASLFFSDISPLNKVNDVFLQLESRKNLKELPDVSLNNIEYLTLIYPKCYPFLGIGNKMIKSIKKLLNENKRLKAVQIPYNGRYVKKVAKQKGVDVFYKTWLTKEERRKIKRHRKEYRNAKKEKRKEYKEAAKKQNKTMRKVITIYTH